jgi:PIN domain nuclease of toxin-antitoxin system
MIMLDTEALIWMDQDHPQLGPAARRHIETAFAADDLWVSVFVFWEVNVLLRLGRLGIDRSVPRWRHDLLTAGLREIPANGVVGVAVDDDLHGNFFQIAQRSSGVYPQLNSPRDKLTSTPPHLLASLQIATALHTGATLVTSDDRFLAYSGIPTIDARV